MLEQLAGDDHVETRVAEVERLVEICPVCFDPDVRCGGERFSAIRFGSTDPVPAAVDLVYRLDVDEYNGAFSAQLVVEQVISA